MKVGAHVIFKHPFPEFSCGLLFSAPVPAPDKKRPNTKGYCKTWKWIFLTQCAKKSKGGNEAGTNQIKRRFHSYQTINILKSLVIFNNFFNLFQRFYCASGLPEHSRGWCR